jgi:hypothetical protein
MGIRGRRTGVRGRIPLEEACPGDCIASSVVHMWCNPRLVNQKSHLNW